MIDEPEDQSKETAKAYAAFLEYCAMGRGRSLPKLAQKFGDSTEKVRSLQRLYERWSSQHKWQQRVKQHDSEIAAERLAKKQAMREEMEDRHAEEAREEQESARRYILALIDMNKRQSDKKTEEAALQLLLSTEKINLGAVVQLLKNSREDERKALVEEEVPKVEPSGPMIGIAIYLPQKQKMLKREDDNDGGQNV